VSSVTAGARRSLGSPVGWTPELVAEPLPLLGREILIILEATTDGLALLGRELLPMLVIPPNALLLLG
jgi:hypothetical protein